MRKRSPLSLILSLGLLGKCHGEGTNLVGTTITRSDIYDHAAITMDLRDMTNYCDQGNLDRARDIYLNGKNAKFSLYSLANKYDHLDDDITFAFQMYGLTEGDVNTDWPAMNDSSHPSMLKCSSMMMSASLPWKPPGL